MHYSTGYSPYFLMFGRHPWLAIDAFLGLSPDPLSAKHQTEYARKLREHLQFAYHTAQNAAQKSAANQKATYDLRVWHSTLHEGYRVLVKNVGLRGKHKLADRWERTPCIIKSQPNPDIAVYEVQSENPKARKTRMLQRNLLLPFCSVGLPCGRDAPRTTQDAPDLVSPEDQIHPMQDDSLVRQPASSTEELDTEDRASESHTSNNNDTPVSRYRIPMRRKSGEAGVYPRSTSPSSMGSFNTESQRPDPENVTGTLAFGCKSVWLNLTLLKRYCNVSRWLQKGLVGFNVIRTVFRCSALVACIYMEQTV